jgi:hypothetical protein
LAWLDRYRRPAYAARLPENWRELVEDLVWFWGWTPQTVAALTVSEILRWTAAARRLGPRVVKAIRVQPR